MRKYLIISNYLVVISLFFIEILSAKQGLLHNLIFFLCIFSVYEMLQCAKECANRSTAAYLTFGEFCVFATELKRCYEKGLVQF